MKIGSEPGCSGCEAKGEEEKFREGEGRLREGQEGRRGKKQEGGEAGCEEGRFNCNEEEKGPGARMSLSL